MDSHAAAGVPVVIIVSDAGVRGEVGDERITAGGWGRGKDVVDIRSVLPRELLGSAYVTQIGYVNILLGVLSYLRDRSQTNQYGFYLFDFKNTGSTQSHRHSCAKPFKPFYPFTSPPPPLGQNKSRSSLPKMSWI